ncbi:AlpA family phage regulatory protein [Pectobacterium versatile]|uniref:AlpA family phage regulatory protein n=1 Tax=Pectobacterium versatile TaxID=2488639 RepID=UPI001CE1FCBD|nr:AlpA family phage regulatory protein [Pectobacterium versatile]MCA5931847.1 AlpA family phage regulatory protein [Pectobacterium versatile]MCA5950651.1 AlpA family phage regulatory protein [Pectobacterium versatile]MCA5953314.1 AlpA family phage regulatory protein [Pectobacterium versatile]UCP85288.1 AlpA family phage regulatory protein [Pectobacterium versatile]
MGLGRRHDRSIQRRYVKNGLKRSQIYLYMKEGTFPSSIKIGPASVAWLESEIDDWINLKLANRLTR